MGSGENLSEQTVTERRCVCWRKSISTKTRLNLLYRKAACCNFFVGDDDLYGLDFEHPSEQKNWRIVYHEKIDASVTAEAVEAMGIPVPPDNEEGLQSGL